VPPDASVLRSREGCMPPAADVCIHCHRSEAEAEQSARSWHAARPLGNRRARETCSMSPPAGPRRDNREGVRPLDVLGHNAIRRF
jgi:hypothetical protein